MDEISHSHETCCTQMKISTFQWQSRCPPAYRALALLISGCPCRRTVVETSGIASQYSVLPGFVSCRKDVSESSERNDRTARPHLRRILATSTLHSDCYRSKGSSRMIFAQIGVSETMSDSDRQLPQSLHDCQPKFRSRELARSICSM